MSAVLELYPKVKEEERKRKQSDGLMMILIIVRGDHWVIIFLLDL